eukprot:TRINITY_DN2406_c0_g1_i11.p1 TRINITY_DN2406_c0_g1~~TRINITY_DN2406_c0_g1_i11.p1  ORF type:complete len:112 (-),score=0.60 TRINITY_DN2406_c0_g1_i11:353-688(-)
MMATRRVWAALFTPGVWTIRVAVLPSRRLLRNFALGCKPKVAISQSPSSSSPSPTWSLSISKTTANLGIAIRVEVTASCALHFVASGSSPTGVARDTSSGCRRARGLRNYF